MMFIKRKNSYIWSEKILLYINFKTPCLVSFLTYSLALVSSFKLDESISYLKIN